jgi:hypothetical protein
MIPSEVPSPSGLTNTVQLHREVVKALSYAQIQRQLSPSSTISATLAAVFRAYADLADPEGAKPKKGTSK